MSAHAQKKEIWILNATFLARPGLLNICLESQQRCLLFIYSEIIVHLSVAEHVNLS